MKSIVLIDKSLGHRERLSRILKSCGLENVEGFRNAQVAVPFIEENGAECVLLDATLPVLTWTRDLDRLEKAAPDAPVVLLTDGDLKNGVKQDLPPGAIASVNKNADKKTLLEAVNRILKSAVETHVVASERAAQDEFMRMLTHDLRAPLRNIRQLSEMAVEQLHQNDLQDLPELLEAQARAAGRATELLADLEVYARLNRTGPKGPVNLAEAARMARNLLKNRDIAHSGSIEIADMPIVTGNNTDLVLVFEHLIENGLTYNNDPQPRVSIRHQRSDKIDVFISDNGTGIDAAHRELIFKPLTRLCSTDVSDGSGMGLAMCRRIVQHHGGTIACRESSDQGSVFHIRFPEPQTLFGVA